MRRPLGAVLAALTVCAACSTDLRDERGDTQARRSDPLTVVRSVAVFERALAETLPLERRGDALVGDVGHLRVALPRLASAPVVITGEHGVRLEVAAEGAAEVAARVVGHATLYANAFPSCDVVLLALPDKLEELRVLHDAAAPTTARYRLRASDGFRITLDAGRAMVVDPAGVVRLAAARPFAIDAAGVRRDLDIELRRGQDGVVLETRLDSAGLRYPIVIDPYWTPLPAMTTAHAEHHAVRLDDGRVVIFGSAGTSTATDIFNPATRTFTDSGHLLSSRRSNAAATRLADGRVLVVGGGGDDETTSRSTAEIYTASVGWRNAAAMPTARRDHAATLLSSGAVLVTGGWDNASSPAMATTEIYSPSSDSWAAGTPMLQPRTQHVVARTSSGKVFVAGGRGGVSTSALTTTEIYDPAAATWTAGPTLKAAERLRAKAIALAGDRVLLVGGTNEPHEICTIAPPSSCVLQTTSSTVQRHAVSGLLPSGKVVVTWAETAGTTATARAHVFDPLSGSATAVTPPATARIGHTATELTDGSILIAGGSDPVSGGTFASADVYVAMRSGAACLANADCESQYCTDGVCCDAACSDTCRACDVMGLVGTCSAVTGAPRGARSCASTGYASCTAGVCGPTCATDVDCASTHHCVASACVAKKPSGAPCGAGRECATGRCIDGFCCESACGEQCAACDVAGSEGSCVPVAGKPHGSRSACPSGSTPCGARKCDGTTRATCEGYVGTEVSCRAASCADGNATLAASCDGKGDCPTAAVQPCGVYACDGAVCRKSCRSDADCATAKGYRCDTVGRECIQGNTCDGPITLVAANKERRDCTPYVCSPRARDGGAGCLEKCTGSADCAAGHVCEAATTTCVRPSGADATESDSGCGLSPRKGARGSLGLALLTLLAFIRRRATLVGAARDRS